MTTPGLHRCVLVATIAVACNRGAGVTPPAGPQPRFFPRMQATEAAPLPLNDFASLAILSHRATIERQHGQAPTPVEGNAVVIAGVSRGPLRTVTRFFGASNQGYLRHSFAVLPGRDVPTLVGIAMKYPGPKPDACARFQAWAARAAAWPCENGSPPDARGSFDLCGGDPSGQLPIRVRCTLSELPEIEISVRFDQVPATLPAPLPPAPVGFTDPPPPPNAARPQPRPALVAAPAPPPNAAAAAPETPFPVEPGISAYDPLVLACDSGVHAFRGLRLSGRSIRMNGSCAMTLTDCAIAGSPNGVSVSGRAALTLVNTRVEVLSSAMALYAYDRATVTVTGGEIRAPGTPVSVWGHARATLNQTRIRGTGTAVTASESGQITVTGSTLEGSANHMDRGRIQDGGGNTGLIVRRL